MLRWMLVLFIALSMFGSLLAQDEDDYDDYDDDYYTPSSPYAENSLFYDFSLCVSGMRVSYIDSMLAAGADVNEHDIYERSVIDVALLYGWSQPCVERLLTAGADIKSPRKDGATVLMLAAEGSDLAVFRRLEAMGFSIDATDQLGRDLWMYAVLSDKSDIFDYLMKARPKHNLDTRAANGETALFRAVDNYGNQTWATQRLLELKAQPNLTDLDGRTALTFAAETCMADRVRILLEGGADVNQADKEGRTPLMFAAMSVGDSEVIEMLLAHGADASAVDKSGYTAYEYAVDNELFGDDELLERLHSAVGK